MSYQETEGFEKLSPAKQKIMKELIQETESTSPEKAMQALFRAQAKLKAAGEEFTKEESRLLLKELMRKLTPGEKEKLNTVLKMLG